MAAPRLCLRAAEASVCPEARSSHLHLTFARRAIPSRYERRRYQAGNRKWTFKRLGICDLS